jgi:hypothetical protein
MGFHRRGGMAERLVVSNEGSCRTFEVLMAGVAGTRAFGVFIGHVKGDECDEYSLCNMFIFVYCGAMTSVSCGNCLRV